MLRIVPAALFALALLTSCASTSVDAHRWNDSHQSRVELLALLQTLNAELLTSPSATTTLERWCGEHELATPAVIVADRVADAQKAPPADLLERLRVNASEVKYRRVRLRCGARVLSEADNWYVPSRLNTEMNRQLDTTDTPFGKVIRELVPYRRTVSLSLLWTPLARGWEMQPRARSTRNAPLDVPREVMVHTAIVYTSDHQPIAAVVETYQRELFAFREH